MEEHTKGTLQAALERIAQLEAEIERLKEENAKLRSVSLSRSSSTMSSKLREALRE